MQEEVQDWIQEQASFRASVKVLEASVKLGCSGMRKNLYKVSVAKQKF